MIHVVTRRCFFFLKTVYAPFTPSARPARLNFTRRKRAVASVAFLCLFFFRLRCGSAAIEQTRLASGLACSDLLF